jgi:hypothetical protein
MAVVMVALTEDDYDAAEDLVSRACAPPTRQPPHSDAWPRSETPRSPRCFRTHRRRRGAGPRAARDLPPRTHRDVAGRADARTRRRRRTGRRRRARRDAHRRLPGTAATGHRRRRPAGLRTPHCPVHLTGALRAQRNCLESSRGGRPHTLTAEEIFDLALGDDIAASLGTGIAGTRSGPPPVAARRFRAHTTQLRFATCRFQGLAQDHTPPSRRPARPSTGSPKPTGAPRHVAAASRVRRSVSSRCGARQSARCALHTADSYVVRRQHSRNQHGTCGERNSRTDDHAYSVRPPD